MKDVIFTFIYCIPTVGFILTALGAFLAWKTLQQTHEWNRRKAAAEVNNGFLAPHIQAHWQRIHAPVLIEKKRYEQLTEPEQISVRELLTYLESVGLLLKHNVIERQIVFELLGGVWPALYRCAEDFIAEARHRRKDRRVFEHFVREARYFVRVADSLIGPDDDEPGPLPPLNRLG